MPDDIAQLILTKLDSLEKGQVTLQGSFSVLEKGQVALEKGQASLQGSVAALEKGQSALQGSVAALEKGQSQIIDRLDRVETLAEDHRDRFDGLLESVSTIVSHTAKIPTLESALGELQSDNKIIKAAVTDTNRDLQGIDERVTMLQVKA